MSLLLKYKIVIALMHIFVFSATCQVNESDTGVQKLKHSISTDPLLPFFNSFALVYEFERTENSSFILGLWYGRASETYPKLLKYPGYVVNVSPIFAYRYYFWKNLHVEYQLYPGYAKYYEENEQQFYNSFNLFNELRVGYRFNYQLFKLPFMINMQYPVGFTIIDTHEPSTFKDIRKQDPVFYIFYPNLYLGIRF